MPFSFIPCLINWFRDMMTLIGRRTLRIQQSVYQITSIAQTQYVSQLKPTSAVPADFRLGKDAHAAPVCWERKQKWRLSFCSSMYCDETSLYLDMVLKQTKGRIKEAAASARIHSRALFIQQNEEAGIEGGGL